MKKIFSLFLIVGVLLLSGAGYFFWQSWSFLQQAQPAAGKIVELTVSKTKDNSPVWYPTVRFTDSRGEVHTFTSSVGSSGWRNSIGRQVEVLYLAGSPSEAEINNFSSLWIATLIPGILGTVFCAIGGGALGFQSMRARRSARLLREGRPIEAEIIGAEINHRVKVNGRSPWRVVCQWHDKSVNEVVLFYSHNLYFNPGAFLDRRKTALVYVDRNNIKRYHMDISWLPKQG
ncbi:DUF3592 domain-containing protein [Entomohabitans teleogrylli]|uniref:DUF3592 domain-containing protein n=1 Tax=Entomohabitans teleogrylli TaxID=1384589 RepID=UPI00073DAAF1|nr:DUF3592 domain-containing protein [Entomohabitans teleogrylli]